VSSTREGTSVVSVDEKVRDLEEKWKRVDALASQYVRPEDAFTTDEFAKRYKMSYTSAKRVLKEWVAAGKAREHTRFQGVYYTLT